MIIENKDVGTPDERQEIIGVCEGISFTGKVLLPITDDLFIEFDGFNGGAYSLNQAQMAQAVIAETVRRAKHLQMKKAKT